MRFLGEPAGVEEIWKKYSHSSEPATNLWTDAYLLALAESLGIQVVSFDRALHERAQNRVALLAF